MHRHTWSCLGNYRWSVPVLDIFYPVLHNQLLIYELKYGVYIPGNPEWTAADLMVCDLRMCIRGHPSNTPRTQGDATSSWRRERLWTLANTACVQRWTGVLAPGIWAQLGLKKALKTMTLAVTSLNHSFIHSAHWWSPHGVSGTRLDSADTIVGINTHAPWPHRAYSLVRETHLKSLSHIHVLFLFLLSNRILILFGVATHPAELCFPVSLAAEGSHATHSGCWNISGK